MLTQNDLKNSVAVYKGNIDETIQVATTVHIPVPETLSFSTLKLTESKIKELVKMLSSGHRKDSEFIYIFRLSPLNTVPTNDLISAFESARSFQSHAEYEGKKNLCRTNVIIQNRGMVLYVGRSRNPRGRLKQHLSNSTSATYAIHLGNWATDLNIVLDFYLYKFKDIEGRVIQVIEDSLWDSLKPLLGKRGEK
jgi:hypothetical protein